MVWRKIIVCDTRRDYLFCHQRQDYAVCEYDSSPPGHDASSCWSLPFFVRFSQFYIRGYRCCSFPVARDSELLCKGVTVTESLY